MIPCYNEDSDSDILDDLIDNLSDFANSEIESNDNHNIFRKTAIKIKHFILDSFSCFIKNPLD